MGEPRDVSAVRLKLAWVGLMILLATACAQTSGTTLGVVTEVDGTLLEVESFTVLSEGQEIVFLPIPTQTYDFPLTHLREHLRTGEPVFVGWETRESTKYATSLADG